MTLTSPAVIVADDENLLLARIREDASALSFSPRGAVRCQGMTLFRTLAARDLACLLDVDPAVESWSCLPTVLLHPGGMHVPDFAVV